MKNNKTFLVLVYTHLWEFFSTFGMTTLLVLYVIKAFNYTDDQAYYIFGSYMALLFASPVILCKITDKLVGYYNSIIIGGLLMALGHFTITIPKLSFFHLSLALMIIGYGLFTPSLITLISKINLDRLDNDNKFIIYYVGQNIGALLAPIICSWFAVMYGLNYGFAIAGIGMLSGLFVFSKHKKYTSFVTHKKLSFKEIALTSFTIFTLILLTYITLTNRLTDIALVIIGIIAVFSLLRIIHSSDTEGKYRIGYIIFMMLFMIVFFAIFSQAGATLILFFERIIDRNIFSSELPAPMLMSIEPVFMILLCPLYIYVQKALAKCNKKNNATIKYIAGLIILGLAFVLLCKCTQTVQLTGQKESITWVILLFFLFPIAELLIIPIGYSIVTQMSPRNYIPVLISIWTLGQATSRFAAQLLSKVASIPPDVINNQNLKVLASHYNHAFQVYAGVLFVSAFILILCYRFAHNLQYKDTTNINITEKQMSNKLVTQV